MKLILVLAVLIIMDVLIHLPGQHQVVVIPQQINAIQQVDFVVLVVRGAFVNYQPIHQIAKPVSLLMLLTIQTIVVLIILEILIRMVLMIMILLLKLSIVEVSPLIIVV